MYIRRPVFYSRAECQPIPVAPGVILLSIALSFRASSANAMRTSLRCAGGARPTDRAVAEWRRVLPGLRAIRGRGTAVFGKFSGFHGHHHRGSVARVGCCVRGG